MYSLRKTKSTQSLKPRRDPPPKTTAPYMQAKITIKPQINKKNKNRTCRKTLEGIMQLPDLETDQDTVVKTLSATKVPRNL